MPKTRPIVFAVCLSSCLLTTACVKKDAILEVGERSATQEQIAKRVAQMRLLQPTVSRADAAKAIIQGWAAAAVLESRGEGLSREQLAEERAKLAQNEEINKLFREVQKIYGQPPEDFLDVGLLPDLALRRLHDVYARENIGSQAARQAAEAFLKDVQDYPASFVTKATEAGATLLEIQLDGLRGTATGPQGENLAIFAPSPQANAEAIRRLASIAVSSSDGRVLSVVLRTTRGHMVARRLSGQEGYLRIQAAFFAKEPFGAWFAEQAKDLRVCIHDPELRRDYTSQRSPVALNCGKE